jgi:type II secretory pathway pseudopilin PulG
VARLQGQRGGGGTILGIIIALIVLAILYFLLVAPLLNWPGQDVLNVFNL